MRPVSFGPFGLLLLLGAVVHCALPGVARAQQTAPPVERVGSSDIALDQRLERLLEGEPVILTRDTLLAADDTLHGSVLVLDATLILEGVVAGDLVIVDAGAFVRPGAVVRGDLVNIGGGLYRSEVARIRGAIIDLPNASYHVEREPDRIAIVASDSPSPWTLDGFMGFQAPPYDRVNGVTARWGARYRLPRVADLTPSVHGQVGWLTERGEPTYAVSGRIAGFATALELGYEKGWVTNDDWIRGDLDNAVNYLWDGDDFRDYHEAERAWVGLTREFGDEEKRYHGVLGVEGQVEDGTSVAGDDPWHLRGDPARPNPAIDDGRITSATASFEVEWHGLETDFEGRIEYEAARDWLDGDFAFDRASAEGDWAMHALADHTLEIEFFVQQPLGTDTLPRQRWSFVGGSGTLQTVEFAEFTGDRVVYTEVKYIIPFPERVALPFVGAPDLQLIHASGMAWLDGEDPAYQQELGARLEFFGLYFRYMLDPADPENNALDVGFSWPFDGSYPWEKE